MKATLSKSRSCPNLAEAGGTSRRAVLAFPGSLLLRNALGSVVQGQASKCMLSEENLQKTLDGCSFMKSQLHLEEGDADFETQLRADLALHFYSGMLNPNVKTATLDRILRTLSHLGGSDETVQALQKHLDMRTMLREIGGPGHWCTSQP